MMMEKEQSTAMCGRFTLFDSDFLLHKVFGAQVSFELTPRYNIAPSQQIVAVRNRPDGGGREIAFLRWGFIPSWSKDPSIGYRMINARVETAAEKPAFRDAFKFRRCLIPASGFYEWKKEARSKQPHYLRMKDGRPFAIAGLWETWKGEGDAPIESCTILTTEANETVFPLHDRMPVILSPGDYDLWLNPEIVDLERFGSIFRPLPAGEMEAFPVGLLVNNPKVEDPRCIEPTAA